MINDTSLTKSDNQIQKGFSTLRSRRMNSQDTCLDPTEQIAKMKFADYENKLQLLQTENKRLQKYLNESLASRKILLSQIDQQDSQLQTLKIETDEIILELERSQRQLQEQQKILENQIHFKDKEITRLQNSIKKKEIDIKTLLESYPIFEENIQRLNEENKNLAQLLTTCEEVNEKNTKLKQELQAVYGKLESSMKNKKICDDKIIDLKNQMDLLLKHYETLEMDVQIKSQELNMMYNTIKNCNEEKESIIEENEKLQNQIQNQKEEFEKEYQKNLTETRKNLQQQIKKIESSYNLQISDLQQKGESIQQDFNDVRIELIKERQQRLELEGLNDKLNQQIKELLKQKDQWLEDCGKRLQSIETQPQDSEEVQTQKSVQGCLIDSNHQETLWKEKEAQYIEKYETLSKKYNELEKQDRENRFRMKLQKTKSDK